ncbi:Tn7-like element transposition protein TnsE, partial [Campylobacter concisus]|uniref:Tn7-like element transposition protein TnsE n=1 Tax=Campylobacter concisus TaxID=199 RepID=UPI001CB6F1FB
LWTMNESVNLQDLILTKLPKNKKLIVFSYGDIYQNETNFSIPIILKEIFKDKPEYFLSFFNLKEICAFPLGTVIENQQKNGTSAGDIHNFQISIGDGLLTAKNLKNIPILDKFMSELPEKIGKYNIGWHKNQQKYSTFTDNLSGRTVIFPHYEIARYFYFTSASMTRQIMSETQGQNSSLDGLYKRATLDNGIGKIYLKFNANNIDAENIYRFVIDKRANNMWLQIRRDMVASKILSEHRKQSVNFVGSRNTMTIQANFPVPGKINFEARVKVLSDGSFLVLKILQENSFYPFEQLKVIRELPGGKKDIIGVIKSTKLSRKDLTNQLNEKTPNILHSSVSIVDKDEDANLEAKLDLLNKTIEFVTITEEDQSREIVRGSDGLLEDKLDLSSNDAEGQGDLNTIEGHLKKEDEDGEQETGSYITIEDLKAMLMYCSDVYCDFSYKILRYEDLPQKPKNYQGKHVWKRATMLDGVTPRKYIVVEIYYKNCRYIILEIQKDKLLETLSTLLIRDYYNSIDEAIVQEIVTNIAKTSNSWLQDLKFKMTKYYLYHPYDAHEKKIQDWGKRLKCVLERYQEK